MRSFAIREEQKFFLIETYYVMLNKNATKLTLLLVLKYCVIYVYEYILHNI